MISGPIVHAIAGIFMTLLGWLLALVPAVPSWLTGSAPQIHDFFAQAAALETWVPIVEAVGVAKDVCTIWAAAALIMFARNAYTAITGKGA